MEIRPVKTEQDYEEALKDIERLFGSEPGTPEGDRLEILSILVEYYEDESIQFPDPDPIEVIEFHMERLNMTRRELEPYIGSRARVSEILNRKRPLTLTMIRKLSEGLNIPADQLITAYPIEQDARIVEAYVLYQDLLVMNPGSGTTGITTPLRSLFDLIGKDKPFNLLNVNTKSNSQSGFLEIQLHDRYLVKPDSERAIQ